VAHGQAGVRWLSDVCVNLFLLVGVFNDLKWTGVHGFTCLLSHKSVVALSIR
jgi:hypothetical protein